MPTPIILKIDVLKIEKPWLFTGAKGTYLDAVVYENDNVDTYGNSHVIKQNPPRELRDGGAKPKIIGNGKWMPQKGGSSRPTSRTATPSKEHPLMQDDADDTIPW